jgi:Flp pilus assembly protein TadD
MRTWVLALAILAAAAGLPAAANDTDGPPAEVAASPDAARQARLDGLFEMLRTADPAQGKVIEAAIWAEWMKSGDPDTDEIMTQAIGAMQEGNLKVALAYLNTLVAARPDYAEAWNKRATVLFYMDDFEGSIADIVKTLALEPRHFGALSGLGMIRLRQGAKQAALEAFERALAVDPTLKNVEGVIEELKDQLTKGI